MATSVDTLIENAQLRVGSAVNAANLAVANVQSEIHSVLSGLTDPNYGLLSMDYASHFPTFATSAVAPPYQPPSATPPESAGLLQPDFTALDGLGFPSTAPSLDTNGLFAFTPPSATIPSFSATAPDLATDIAGLASEIAGIALPAIGTVNFPSISAIPATEAVYTPPTYLGDTNIADIADPTAYDDLFAKAYRHTGNDAQGFIDGYVQLWVDTQSPGFYGLRDALEAKLADALANGLLPDAYATPYEQAIFGRAVGRIEQAAAQAVATTTANFARGNFLAITGGEAAALNAILIGKVSDIATQATEVYVQRRQQDIDRYQDILTRVAQQMTEIRNYAYQYAQTQLAILQFASTHANTFAGQFVQVYEHLIKRGGWRLDVLRVLNERWSGDLESERTKLDAARLNLGDLRRLSLDAENAAVQQAAEQVKALEVSVANYSGLINAVVQKGELEKLKNLNFQTQAEVYKAQVEAQVAAFNVYGAAMDGDQKKLDGEVAKLKVFEEQIAAAQAQVDAQKAKLAAVSDYNQSALAAFNEQNTVYTTLLDTSIKQFESFVEAYKAQLEGDINVFNTEVEAEKAVLEMDIEAFKANADIIVGKLQHNVQTLQVAMQGLTEVASGQFQIATAASQALGTMVSSATTS